ncbi:GTPase IMAP family member 8-like [Engraulis encrasicolus]|uniref:GTPase IMAP family member 8-like n=1 Tax=Engraulis encrasicolus TaxID=184585 RepID=UPI002FD30E14
MTSVDPPGHGHHPSTLRIVLLGGRELGNIEASGKTSSANTILGRDDSPVRKRTAISVKSEGHRFGRHMTVVDTPGWWWHYSLEHTPKRDQMELSNGTALCHPGPHAFLLVIPVDMIFPCDYRLSLEEHIRVLGDIWKYTLVLLTSNGPSNYDAFTSHLKDWSGLQWVIGKCQNRYHILDNKNRDDEYQVLRLLNKIDEMVELNQGHCFESVENPFIWEQWRQTVKEGAEKRIKKVKSRMARHLESQRSDSTNRDQPDYLKERRIVVVGPQYGTRSSSGNTILGRKAFVEGSKRTVRSSIQQGIVAGRHITVVDTPGWYFINPLSATTTMDKLEMKCGLSLCPPGPHVILLTIPVASAYNKVFHQALMEHMLLLGEDVWDYTIILFGRGDWLGDTIIEEHIETEGEYLQTLIVKCGNRYHVFNNKNREDKHQVDELFEKIDELVARNHGSCYEMDRDEVRIFKGSQQIPKSVLCQAQVFNKNVSVVNTPSWSTAPDDASVLVEQEIARGVSMFSPGPHAFLLVIPADESFTQEDREATLKHMARIGQNVWKHTILLFTWRDWLGEKSVEEFIVSEGGDLRLLVEKCGYRYHALSFYEDDFTSQVSKLLEKVDELMVRNRGKPFAPEEKQSKLLRFQKTLTEEEWIKREDDLIERMLKAVVTEPDTSAVAARDGSIPISIPDSKLNT